MFKDISLRTIEILIIIICMFTCFIIGFGIGEKNKIESVEGVYNIKFQKSSRVIITTKLNYIERDDENNVLIIHGTPAGARK